MTSSSSLSLSKINQATPGVHLQDLVLCTTMTPTDKVECCKVLKIILKNLADPVKANDVSPKGNKYRQLRLENAKIQQTVGRHEHAMLYLQALGFTQVVEDGDPLLKLKLKEHEPQVNVALFATSLQEVTTALEMVGGGGNEKNTTTTTTASNNSNKRSISRCSSSTLSSSSSAAGEEKKSSYEPPQQLSEKQKARILMDQKEKEEKERAKQLRKQTSAQIKMDKHARLHDPNWKPSVSAAAAKAGDSMSTFRDKFGEN